MLGNMRSVFVGKENRIKHFQWYLYDQIIGNVVAYDATLQGGFFNHSSVYTIPSSQVNRLVLQNKMGVGLTFHRLCLEYYQTGSTSEFSTTPYHRTGGLQIGFGF
jgi:hypothetical protein